MGETVSFVAYAYAPPAEQQSIGRPMYHPPYATLKFGNLTTWPSALLIGGVVWKFWHIKNGVHVVTEAVTPDWIAAQNHEAGYQVGVNSSNSSHLTLNLTIAQQSISINTAELMGKSAGTQAFSFMLARKWVSAASTATLNPGGLAGNLRPGVYLTERSRRYVAPVRYVQAGPISEVMIIPGCVVVYKGRAWIVVAPAQGPTRTIEQVFPYMDSARDRVQTREEYVPLTDLALLYNSAGVPLIAAPPKFAIGSEVAWAPRLGSVCELATVSAVRMVPYALRCARRVATPDMSDLPLRVYEELFTKELLPRTPNYTALNAILHAVAVCGPLVPTYTYTLRADPVHQGYPAIQDMTDAATASTYDQARGSVRESNIAARPKLRIGARVSLAGLDFHDKIISTALSKPESGGSSTEPSLFGDFMEPDYNQSADKALAILQDLAKGTDHPVYGREARAAIGAAKKVGQLGVWIKNRQEVSGDWISRKQRLREATLDLAYRAREPVQCFVTAIFLRGGGRRHCTPAASASYAKGVAFKSFLPPYISYTGQDEEHPWSEPPRASYVAPESGTKFTYLIQWRPRDTAVGQQTYMLNSNALTRQKGSLTCDDLNSRCNRALNDPSDQQWRWKSLSFRPAEVMAVDPGNDFYYEKEQYYAMDGTRPMRTRITPLIDSQSVVPPQLRAAVEAQTLLVASEAKLTIGRAPYNPANRHSMISVLRYMNRLTSALGPWDDPANRLTMACPTGAVLVDEGSDRWNDPTSTVGTADTPIATQYEQTPLRDIIGVLGSKVNVGGAQRVLNCQGAWPYGCTKCIVTQGELADQANNNVHLDTGGVASRQAALLV